ncbi:glucosidase 2 subunit beta [Anguilla rostrata]|uniref:glucosidase 2 subunit beta n=1 Tax=Anguilla rostrata TaxID=7938 RepID=UPI0030CBD782
MSSSPLLLLSLCVALGAAVEIQRPRGVPLSKRQFYPEDKPFTCLDGSRTVPFDRVNDDYCDCTDGSDEPGTAACPNGSFHCTNAGFRPSFIPSSRINDGVCDCCSRHASSIPGKSSPWVLREEMWTKACVSARVRVRVCDTVLHAHRELGKKERESLQKMAEITKEGFLLKQQLIEEAKKGLQEKQRKLTEVQESKKTLEEKVEALRTVKETAEKPEKEAKERHLKAWEEQKAILRLEKDKAKMAEAFLELDDNADGFVSVEELQSHPELDTDGDGTLSETETQGLLGGADRVDTTAFQTIWSSLKDKYQSESQPEAPPPVETPPEEPLDAGADSDAERYPEEDLGDDAEDDDDDDEEDDHEDDDDKAQPPARTEQKGAEEEGAMPPYDEETQALITAAQKARDEFEEAERSLREMDDQIKSLDKEISFDFGPSAEFAYLYSQCYELTTSEYIYRLCPFNRVSQKPKFGGSETNLGSWGSWAGPEDNKYLVMKYEHGMGCWQGPNRSTTVKLTCGKDSTVVSTSEPSRCEYQMEFTTPAVCQEPPHLDGPPHDEF